MKTVLFAVYAVPFAGQDSVLLGPLLMDALFMAGGEVSFVTLSPIGSPHHVQAIFHTETVVAFGSPVPVVVVFHLKPSLG